MSWNIRIDECYGGAWDAAVDKAVAGWRNDNPTATEDLIEQVNAAARAAKLIASSGAVGRDYEMDFSRDKAGEHFGVWFVGSISGHSNPDHLPRGGWANDTISVHVNQVTKRDYYVAP